LLAADLAERRHGGRQPVVALDPHDLLDQILLPLEVGSEARHLHLDAVVGRFRGDLDLRERLRRRCRAYGVSEDGCGATRTQRDLTPRGWSSDVDPVLQHRAPRPRGDQPCGPRRCGADAFWVGSP
jgi:hypothetical protein